MLKETQKYLYLVFFLTIYGCNPRSLNFSDENNASLSFFVIPLKIYNREIVETAVRVISTESY